MKTTTKKKAQKLAAEWQHRLGLCDWTITWELSQSETVIQSSYGECYGYCEAEPRFMRATIAVALEHPIAFVTDTIKHELLHLRLAMLKHLNELTVQHGRGAAMADAWCAIEEGVVAALAKLL